MADRFVVTAAGTLFEQLSTHLRTWSRNTLRQRLRLGCIEVDGEVTVSHDRPVAPGAVVVIRAKEDGRVATQTAASLPVLYLDDDLLAIDKPVGLLSVGTDDQRERTALALARSMVQRTDRGADVWPVHRLDRETSGVLLFARSRAIRDQMQGAWSGVQKIYVAIVEGVPSPPDGQITAPLWEDRNLRVHVGARPGARPAVTRYRTVRTAGGRSQLEVEIDTGRKHQIRAHLAWLGHPVVGDERYGRRASRMCLHAERLVFDHPRDGRRLELVAPVPGIFRDGSRFETVDS